MLRKKNKKTISFIIASKLNNEPNQRGENLYNDNYKTLKKELEGTGAGGVAQAVRVPA
jgi:hypothetical protein